MAWLYRKKKRRCLCLMEGGSPLSLSVSVDQMSLSLSHPSKEKLIIAQKAHKLGKWGRKVFPICSSLENSEKYSTASGRGEGEGGGTFNFGGHVFCKWWVLEAVAATGDPS